MPIIRLETKIQAPIELVFDAARNIDLHQKSTSKTNEKAIAGKTSGLLELGETVTWRAKHLGVNQNLSVQMTQLDFPTFFEDTMLQGTFQSMQHQHFFERDGDFTIMKDVFEYQSPFGFLGKLVDFLFLEKYMTRFLEERNRELKEWCERETRIK